MFTNFSEAEAYLNERKSLGIKPGLDRIKTLLRLLGHPEKRIRGIHVAGTNGKGSTVQYIKNALIQNNYNVGVFTSPSLDSLTGYMFINDHAIDKQTFVKLLNDMYPIISEMDKKEEHPTEFEIVTALAFLFFAAKVDFTLIETGMGGRADTTNCFVPLLSIITNVSRDHMTFLGDTIEEIAYQKAGIIKRDTAAVIGPMQHEATQVMKREAETKHADLIQFGHDFQITSSNDRHFWWENRLQSKYKITLCMQGKHQQINASLAIMAVYKLKEMGIPLNMNDALRGVEQTIFPGRFELINQHPSIIVDGAHNEAGMKTFIDTVKALQIKGNKHLVFAAFKDKDIESMLNQLDGEFDTITLTTFEHNRAATTEQLAKYGNFKNIVVEDDWKLVMNQFLYCPESSTDLFVAGSLDFISKVKKFIASKQNI